MDAAVRGSRRGRTKKPISFSVQGEGSKAGSHSRGEPMAKSGEHKSKNGSDLEKLKEEIKNLKEELSVAEIKSSTFRDDFQQERKDRERAMERYESLQQTMADFESKIGKYKEENEDLTEQLNAARQTIARQEAELEAAKEEIAVKVAQVKQYQKQVEAYKQQVLVDRSGEDPESHQKSNRKRKSDDTGSVSKHFKQSSDSTHGYAEYCTEETNLPSIKFDAPETSDQYAPKHETQQLMVASTNTRIQDSDTLNKASPSRCMSGVSRASIPNDPNLQCPICTKIFKKGEIQMFRLHVQRCSEFVQ